MGLNNKSKPCGALVDEKFGKLTVLKEEVILKSGKTRVYATCKCECGGEKTCDRSGLTTGRTTSCGCVRRETTITFNKTKKKPEGTLKRDDRRYNMFHNVSTNDKRSPNNPSLDQINPGKGYTLDNIQVISSRANWLKADATLQELKTLVENLEAL